MTAAEALRSVPGAAGDLADASPASGDRLTVLQQVAARYAVAITPAVADMLDPRDPHDPIAKQFLPDARELEQQPQENADPIGDEAHSPVQGIVHRYPDRVLLKLVNACAVYCRFCFRREMVGPGRGGLSRGALDAALHYIARTPEIWEVILTGGDPLVLSPRRLKDVMTRIAEIDHVVLHANHARELTPVARTACARLIDAGIPMLSQSVLLRGVNDDAGALGELMRALVESRIKPYYLHHADLAPGTAHFRTTISEGQALMRTLHGRLSGLCQPTYVLDVPGGHGKSPIGPTYLKADCSEIEDFRGRRHAYPPRQEKTY